jgi:HEAT repeat protein
LVARLNQRDPVGYLAAMALGDMGREAECAVPALIDVLRGPEARTRELAVDALGKIGPGAKAALAALVQVLKKGQENRQNVAQAIARIDQDAAKLLRDHAANGGLVFAANAVHLSTVLEQEVDTKAWKKSIQELEKKYPPKPQR